MVWQDHPCYLSTQADNPCPDTKPHGCQPSTLRATQMPTKPRARCTKCKRLHPGRGLCEQCKAAAEKARGSAWVRGYDRDHRQRFRAGVLDKHPRCVCEKPGHAHNGTCAKPSTRADHWPRSRRQLEALGLDPSDPACGRGLCESCHNAETAANQPGGWNRRD